jgi:hypothetical protein
LLLIVVVVGGQTEASAARRGRLSLAERSEAMRRGDDWVLSERRNPGPKALWAAVAGSNPGNLKLDLTTKFQRADTIRSIKKLKI